MNHTVHRRDINAQARSPRQIAKKAYNTASKKISLDNRRKKQHYHMRERLLIQNTMIKAELMLNNQASELSNCKVMLSDPYDNIHTPICFGQGRHYPPPPPLSTSELPESSSISPHCLESLSPTTPIPISPQTDLSLQPGPILSLPATNTSIQKSPSSFIIPFQFLHNIINYLRLPFSESWRLPQFISWSAFFFTRRDRGIWLRSTHAFQMPLHFLRRNR